MVLRKYVLTVTVVFFCNHWSGSCKVSEQKRPSSEYVISKYPEKENKEISSYTSPSPGNLLLPDAVYQFKDFAADEVDRCQILADTFDVEDTINLEELQAAVFFLVTTLAAQAGYQSPASNAISADRTIINRCDKFSPNLLLTVYTHTVGRYLYNESILTSESAQNLANSYMSVTKDVAKRIVNKEYPRSKVTAIIIGVENFLSSLNIFTTDGIRQVADLYADEWDFHLNINVTDQSVPISRCAVAETYSRKRNPVLLECEYVCRLKYKYIDQFNLAFETAVKSSKILTDLFTLPLKTVTPKIFSRGNFYVSLRFLEQRNAWKPPFLADFMSRFIRDAKSMDFDLLVSVHSNFMAKFLLSEKVLNGKNAKSLANKYAQVMEQQARIIVERQYQNSKIVAIQFGYWSFLSVSGGRSLAKFAFYYGNEWKCATKYATKE